MKNPMRTFRGVQLADLPQLEKFTEQERHEMRVVAHLLPFKGNNYVLEELIDWSSAPDDPIFRMTFPAREMVPPRIYDLVSDALLNGVDRKQLQAIAQKGRQDLNPHPSGQREHNVPLLDGEPVPGLQHKYRQTLLVFPSQGQTCHSYCSYCFRWAQFVGDADLKFAAPGPGQMIDYLRGHREVTDVLLTGGDPLIMSTPVLARWVTPLLAPDLEHVTNIRLGTKALVQWPYRVTSGPDADELLRLIEACATAGKSVAIMLHVSHPRELESAAAAAAVARLRSAGATVRAQAPIIRHVNDSPQAWATMWRQMVRLGIQPYYTFVERDTGASSFFEVPLARALTIYQQAQRAVSGLARTARGPVMSATPGKIAIDGETVVNGERLFVLRLLQARDEALAGTLFFAGHSESAVWIDQLTPALSTSWPWEASRDRTQPETFEGVSR
ncbi:MAG: lysine 2,3-aminomutase [Rhodococcus sp. (in: high G+C Gram-positive bacteria)]|nr:MAG: lysine 2,3-aminomutase [Rhodococcus sp. (in: high G+C Gram-positive bacteria)]